MYVYVNMYVSVDFIVKIDFMLKSLSFSLISNAQFSIISFPKFKENLDMVFLLLSIELLL